MGSQFVNGLVTAGLESHRSPLITALHHQSVRVEFTTIIPLGVDSWLNTRGAEHLFRAQTTKTINLVPIFTLFPLTQEVVGP
jgi:hypothetical protein